VVSLALGSWISGELTSWGLRNLGIEKGGLTMVTPGLDLDEAVDMLESFAGTFDGTVLYSYPPFARTILEKAEERNLPLGSYRMGLRLTGEGYSERYRDRLNELMGNDEGALHSIFSGYGSTDFGSLGKETPLCIAIRRILYEKDLAAEVLGRDEIPSLCQYDPSVFHAELAGEELVVSKYQAAPLLIYRTGDRASLMPYDEMTERLTSAGVDPVKILESRGGDPSRIRNLPFVLAWGRIDGGVTFFGVNILVEQVREIIEGDDRFRECCTGQFQIRKTERGDLDQVLEILLEPRPGIRGDADALAEPMVEALSRTSAEYAAVRKNQGDKALPKLLFVEDRELFGGTKFRYAR
jgi:phenylacetate-CoA ligase